MWNVSVLSVGRHGSHRAEHAEGELERPRLGQQHQQARVGRRLLVAVAQHQAVRKAVDVFLHTGHSCSQAAQDVCRHGTVIFHTVHEANYTVISQEFMYASPAGSAPSRGPYTGSL